MTKSISANDLQAIANIIVPTWEQDKNSVRISAISMYRLIALKKKIHEEALKLAEAVTAIAENMGGQRLENGAIKVPDDKIAEMNEELARLGDEKVELEYQPIVVKEGENLPISIMEALIDFVEISE